MKIFLSALETNASTYTENFQKLNYLFNLMSYYYLRNNTNYIDITNRSKEIMIDSGAHSFQQGKKVDWLKYTKEYADFITSYDNDKVVGYFEMDIDPAGYPLEFVEHLRKILTRRSNKIIPVWHKNRGLQVRLAGSSRLYSGRLET